MEKKDIHAGHRTRIRERFDEQGLDAFAEHEVLELLLTFAIPRRDVNPLAHELIDTFGSLSGVLEADKSELMRVSGVGEQAALLLTMMPPLLRRYQKSAFGIRPSLINFAQAKAYCQTLFHGMREEHIYLLCLDSGGRLLHPVLLRKGTLDEVAIYPREIMEAVIRYHASGVILAHNHPSGNEQPSKSDFLATGDISAALATISVKLLDHLVCAGDSVFSMTSCVNGLELNEVQYLSSGARGRKASVREEDVFCGLDAGGLKKHGEI